MAQRTYEAFRELLHDFEELIIQQVNQRGFVDFVDEVVAAVAYIVSHPDPALHGTSSVHQRWSAHIIVYKILKRFYKKSTGNPYPYALYPTSGIGSALYRRSVEAVLAGHTRKNCIKFLDELYIASLLNASREVVSFKAFLISKGVQADFDRWWPDDPGQLTSTVSVSRRRGSVLAGRHGAQRTQLDEELLTLGANLVRERDTIKKENDALTEEKEGLEEENSALRAEKEALQASGSILNDEKQALQQENAELKRQNADLSYQLVVAKAHRKKFNSRLVLEQDKNRKIEAQKAKLVAQIQQARNLMADAWNKLDSEG